MLTAASSISEEDRREIMADIEEVVKENRITVTEDLFRIKPRKNGVLLPTMINLMAVAAVGAAFFFSARLFEARQENMNLEVTAVASAEGRLIEELKKESAARIAEKEQEILDIQQELGRIEEQTRNLQADFKTTLERREAELRADLAAALEKETRRLQALDISPAEIDNRLREFEILKQQELQSKLEEFRLESQADLRAKEEELARSKVAAQQILREANTEKEKIIAEASQREADLTARYEEERIALQAETSEAQSRLKEIARLQETENLITDQILAFYQSIMNSMASEEYTAALTGIASLRNLLADPRIDNLPRISKRRGVERYILDTLQGEIEVQQNAETANTTDLVNAAQRLFSTRALVAEADKALAEGRRDEARELYSKAIAALPALEKAIGKLEELQAESRNARADRLLAEGEAYLQNGDTGQALSSYRLAAAASVPGESQRLLEAVKRIENTLTSDYSAEQSRLSTSSREEMETLRREYETRIAELEVEAERREQELTEQVSGLLASVETLGTDLGGKEAEVTELQGIITEGKELLADYETRLQQAREELAAAMEKTGTGGGSLSDEQIAGLKQEYSSQIREKEARISDLSNQLSATAKNLSMAQNHLSRSEEQRKQLEKDLDAAVVELVDVVTQRQGDDRYSALAKGYTAYQTSLNSLLGGSASASDYGKAEEVLKEFFADREIQGIFPGIAEFNRKLTDYKFQEGRRDVLSRTEQFTTYLEEGNTTQAERIAEEANNDPLFKKVIEKIRALLPDRE